MTGRCWSEQRLTRSLAKALRNYETLSQQALPIVPHDAKLTGFLAEVSNPKADSRFSNRFKHFTTILVD